MVIGDPKECNICARIGIFKKYRNIALHQLKAHPEFVERALSDSQTSVTSTRAPELAGNQNHAGQPVNFTPIQRITPPFSVQTGQNYASPSEIINRTLQDLVAIQLIKALSSENPGSLVDVAKIMNPAPQNPSLDDLKKYHDTFYSTNEPTIINTGGTDWAGIIQNALPIINKMMANRKPQQNNGGEDIVREGNRETGIVLESISPEIAGNSTEPKSP
jgi:hypothetical protein